MKTLLTFLSFLIYLFQSLLLFIYSFLVSELSSIRDILSIGFVALEQRGKAFVRPLCNLMEVIGLPYVRTKSHEEYSSNAVAALSDILRVLVAVLMWNEPEIQLAAVASIGSLVCRDQDNQTAAASAGAVAELMQLGRSDDYDNRRAAVEALRTLVANHENFDRFTGRWAF